jgi:transposase InsO family protein
MIQEEAKRRARILTFWKKHGLEATKEAFGTPRSTLFRWQKALKEGQGKLEVLNKQSTAPINRRKRIIPQAVENLILQEREWERIGKEKLADLLKEDKIAVVSASTVGRMLKDLKGQGKLPDPVRLTFNGKTGRVYQRKTPKSKLKLRSKGHQGGLVKADTVVRFTNGIKRYIATAIDKESKFSFAYAYTTHSSQKTADFMNTFQQVAPLQITHVQTDNGSEFGYHFELLLKKENITHFHSYPRCPKMQSEIERFNRTLSDAFIKKYRHLLAYDLDAFNQAMMEWLLWYNTRRPHWSLGLVAPLKYICNKLSIEESHKCWTSTNT